MREEVAVVGGDKAQVELLEDRERGEGREVVGGGRCGAQGVARAEGHPANPEERDRNLDDRKGDGALVKLGQNQPHHAGHQADDAQKLGVCAKYQRNDGQHHLPPLHGLAAEEAHLRERDVEHARQRPRVVDGGGHDAGVVEVVHVVAAQQQRNHPREAQVAPAVEQLLQAVVDAGQYGQIKWQEGLRVAADQKQHRLDGRARRPLLVVQDGKLHHATTQRDLAVHEEVAVEHVDVEVVEQRKRKQRDQRQKARQAQAAPGRRAGGCLG